MGKEKTKSKKPKSRSGHKRVLVPKWKLFRAKEPLISVFMWGVNHSIGELMHVPPPALLLPDDFKAYSKEYCPNVFRNIREQFGVDQYGYLTSLTVQEPELEPNETTTSNRLFVSHDKQFVVKVIDSEAVAEIHSILRQYHEYVVEQRGKTLLPQYLGLYRVTVDVSDTYMLVMRNIFGGKYDIHKKYDLKGSTVQRQASEKEKSKELPTLKDNDFLVEKYKLLLPTDAKAQLMAMLKSDTEFLTRLHLMDYSLLVGIHDIELDREQQQQKEERTAASATAASSPPQQAEMVAVVCGGGGAAPSAIGTAPPPLTSTSTPTTTTASEMATMLAKLHQQQGSDVDSGGEGGGRASPPDSPIPSASAFTTTLAASGGLNLDDEFFAIPSSEEFPRKLLYFIGLVDILTYYGVKKRTETAAKTVKYGSGAENISTVKPEQYAKRLLEFVNRNVVCPPQNSTTTDVLPTLSNAEHPQSNRQIDRTEVMITSTVTDHVAMITEPMAATNIHSYD
uniref:PIPK domain-containing protein n=1 Tax=Globodera pallida TaxID=36090 RepID=A0A183CAX0_GLOPA